MIVDFVTFAFRLGEIGGDVKGGAPTPETTGLFFGIGENGSDPFLAVFGEIAGAVRFFGTGDVGDVICIALGLPPARIGDIGGRIGLGCCELFWLFGCFA